MFQNIIEYFAENIFTTYNACSMVSRKEPTGRSMERICNISDNFSKAEEWDIEQQISMTAEERQDAARALKERFYGKDCPDVRDQYKK